MKSVSDDLRILISYYYADNFNWSAIERHVAAGRCKILLDSGAFSAHTLGKQIALKDYCAWLKPRQHLFWNYFTLDVVLDPQQTLYNYRSMVDQGFNPIPIITRGTCEGEDVDLYMKNDWVAFGGFKHVKDIPTIQRLISYAHSHDTKIHMLGMTATAPLLQTRPDSCDSSSWLGARQYGSPVFWDFTAHRLKQYSRHKQIPTGVYRFFRHLNLTIEYLTVPEAWKGTFNPLTQVNPLHGYISQTSFMAWILFQRYLTSLGVRLWLVSGDIRDTEALLYCNRYLKEILCTTQVKHSTSAPLIDS